MNRMQTFRIGKHLVEIDSATECTDIVPALKPFETEQTQTTPCLYVELDPDMPANRPEDYEKVSDLQWENARAQLYRRKDQNGYLLRMLPQPYHTVYEATFNTDFSRCRTILHQQPADGYALNNVLMMGYAMSMASTGTLLLHAAAIVHQGKAFLFLGRSGTGKSTHSRLWLKHIPECHLLNDDNPVVHIDAEGKVTAFGSPWSGKTPCYRQEAVPLGAIVRLEQAPRNSIRRETVTSAFCSLLASCSRLQQDEKISRRIVETVTQVAERIPMFHLECLPDEEAAFCCHDAVCNCNR